MDQRTLLRIAFIPAVLVLALVFAAVPKFVEVYLPFENALPNLTRFWFRWYPALAFVPFVFLVPWFAAPHAPKRGLHALLLSIIVSAAVVAFGALACYLPLFHIAQKPEDRGGAVVHIMAPSAARPQKLGVGHRCR